MTPHPPRARPPLRLRRHRDLPVRRGTLLSAPYPRCPGLNLIGLVAESRGGEVGEEPGHGRHAQRRDPPRQGQAPRGGPAQATAPRAQEGSIVSAHPTAPLDLLL